MDWTVLLTGPGIVGAALVIGVAASLAAYPILRLLGSNLCHESPIPELFLVGVALILMPVCMFLSATFVTALPTLWRFMLGIAAWGAIMAALAKLVGRDTPHRSP
jgi:hypothetical protein